MTTHLHTLSEMERLGDMQMAGILFVVHELLTGGTETHVLTLATALRKEGHDVGVFTSGGSFQRLFRKEELKIHLAPRFDESTKSAGSRLRRVLKKYNYGIVHVHDVPGYRLLRKVRVKAKIVMTLHGMYQVHKEAYKLASKADAIIAVSGRVKQEFRRRFGQLDMPIHVIPNGIDTEKFKPRAWARSKARVQDEAEVQEVRNWFGIPSDAFVVGYAGRFTLDKLPLSKHVSKTLVAYAESDPTVYALIAGRASSHVLGAYQGERIRVLGSYDRMELFYQACDVVVGTGRVALEAVMCEVPTIAVGSAGYFGRIHSKNLKRVVFANFADHGTPVGVDRTRLMGAIRFVRSHRDLVMQEISTIRLYLLTRFSVKQLLPRIERIYDV